MRESGTPLNTDGRRISNVEVAHTTWNIFQTVHEGTETVKINKL